MANKKIMYNKDISLEDLLYLIDENIDTEKYIKYIERKEEWEEIKDASLFEGISIFFEFCTEKIGYFALGILFLIIMFLISGIPFKVFINIILILFSVFVSVVIVIPALIIIKCKTDFIEARAALGDDYNESLINEEAVRVCAYYDDNADEEGLIAYNWRNVLKFYFDDNDLEAYWDGHKATVKEVLDYSLVFEEEMNEYIRNKAKVKPKRNKKGRKS